MADRVVYANLQENGQPFGYVDPPVPKPRAARTARSQADEESVHSYTYGSEEEATQPVLPVKARRRPSSNSSTTSSGGVRHSYDEVTLVSGKPVASDQDPFQTITFRSPMQTDPAAAATVLPLPVPAPRFSIKQRQTKGPEQRYNRYEEVTEEPLPVLRSQYSEPADSSADSRFGDYAGVDESGTELRAASDSREDIYTEIESLPDADDEDFDRFGARPRDASALAKSDTICMRNILTKWYDQASKEVEHDLSLDLDQLENRVSTTSSSGSVRERKPSSHAYEHVALSEPNRCDLVNRKLVDNSQTLLRNFDPLLMVSTQRGNPEEESKSKVSSSSSSIVLNDNLYVAFPFEGEKREQDDMLTLNSGDYGDLPPPMAPPPPLPVCEPPPVPRRHAAYENVWLGRSNSERCRVVIGSADDSNNVISDRKSDSQTQSSPSIDDGLLPVPLAAAADEDEEVSSAFKSSAAETASEVELDEADGKKSGWAAGLASNFKRKMSLVVSKRRSPSPSSSLQTTTSSSSLVLFPQSAPSEVGLEELKRGGRGWKTNPERRSSCLDDCRPKHSGVLYVCGNPNKRKQFHVKWCVLGNGTFSYFDDKYSLAIPKEQIPVADVVSVVRRRAAAAAENNSEHLHCFDVAFADSASPTGLFSSSSSSRGACYSSRYCERSFGAICESDRDVWLEKLARNLDRSLSSFSLAAAANDSYFRLSWVYMKTGFACEWISSWVSIVDDLDGGNRALSYLPSSHHPVAWINLDMKKIKNLTLVKDVKNLNAPLQFPVLVIDAIDKSLYLMPTKERECVTLKDLVESAAFNNTNDLNDQQLTQDDIPVVVDECVKFVYSQGCMTEGVYRVSGVNTKIDKLLKEFKRNAWSVRLSREEFSEHDVANVLKRFVRTLREPLLTDRLRSGWIEASTLHDADAKVAKMKRLLAQLPDLNYNTLKRLLAHLRSVSNHSDRNMMDNANLSALWGPTLMTVDAEEEEGCGDAQSSSWMTGFVRSTSECDVCNDLLEHFAEVFDVPQEEVEREQKISDVLEKLHLQDKGRCCVKRSGDVRMWVYIESKSSGNYVCLDVHPTMKASEMVAAAASRQVDGGNHVLHEVVLQGQLERVIHHKEVVLEVTLKWSSWSEQDRRDNYLLLKPTNPFFEEALCHAMPPMSVFGEAKFSCGQQGSGKRLNLLLNSQSSSFKKHSFSMNNARILCFRDSSGTHEIGSWPIEDIWWYFGCERRRQPPHRLNITFFWRNQSMERTKLRPFFGNVVSFDNHELFVRWVAAMLVAEHDTDVAPPKKLLLID